MENELRIGNLVKWEDESNEIVQITGIYLDKEMDNKDYYAISFIDPYGITENDGTAFLDEFIGIPITKEWLLHFEFKLSTNKGCTYYYPKNDEYEIFIVGENSLFNVNDSPLINIKYVHQLQNIIFALTGEELKLKEK